MYQICLSLWIGVSLFLKKVTNYLCIFTVRYKCIYDKGRDLRVARWFCGKYDGVELLQQGHSSLLTVKHWPINGPILGRGLLISGESASEAVAPGIMGCEFKARRWSDAVPASATLAQHRINVVQCCGQSLQGIFCTNIATAVCTEASTSPSRVHQVHAVRIPSPDEKAAGASSGNQGLSHCAESFPYNYNALHLHWDTEQCLHMVCVLGYSMAIRMHSTVWCLKSAGITQIL